MHENDKITTEIDDPATIELNQMILEFTEINKKETLIRKTFNQIHEEEIGLINALKAKTITLEKIKHEYPHINEYKQMKEIKNIILNTKKLMPKQPQKILSLSLGTIYFNFSDKDKMRYKQEYEYFKLKMTGFAFILAIFSLIITPNRWIDSLLCFQLLYFYSSLSIREQILELNGSCISSWWKIHHYLSICITSVLLIWPINSSYSIVRVQLLLFCIYNAILQFLLFRYQMIRLYTLRALNKADMMETTNEAFNERIFESFFALIPFIFIGQIFQLFNSINLFRVWLTTENAWHPLIAGIVFLIFAFGNFFATVSTYLKKRRSRHNLLTHPKNAH